MRSTARYNCIQELLHFLTTWMVMKCRVVSRCVFLVFTCLLLATTHPWGGTGWKWPSCPFSVWRSLSNLQVGDSLNYFGRVIVKSCNSFLFAEKALQFRHYTYGDSDFVLLFTMDFKFRPRPDSHWYNFFSLIFGLLVPSPGSVSPAYRNEWPGNLRFLVTMWHFPDTLQTLVFLHIFWLFFSFFSLILLPLRQTLSG